MASMTKFVVFFVGLFLVIDAKEVDVCKDQHPTKDDFELPKLAGRWHVFVYPYTFENVNSERCYKYHMTVVGDDVHFTISYLRKNETSEERRTLEGKLSSDPDSPGTVRSTMPAVGRDDTFHVVDAKYDDYVISHVCNNSPFNKSALVSVITRDDQLSDAKKKSLLQKLKSLQFDTERLKFDTKENC
ncbi:uncharacterized protein LOC118182012 [Stegodyphus dumicola]|uniref:uncharacterized protein LOC118182012 n=1 Tax=Stegodyphus dumicola TaxID=202533 RepID=UPI0015AF82E5|nr:uncharacterized protein LOC118182012 [Stegodyphus dumicola]